MEKHLSGTPIVLETRRKKDRKNLRNFEKPCCYIFELVGVSVRRTRYYSCREGSTRTQKAMGQARGGRKEEGSDGGREGERKGEEEVPRDGRIEAARRQGRRATFANTYVNGTAKFQ